MNETMSAPRRNAIKVETGLGDVVRHREIKNFANEASAPLKPEPYSASVIAYSPSLSRFSNPGTLFDPSLRKLKSS